MAFGFITVFISLILKDSKKEYALYISLIGGIIILFLVVDYLEGILTFLEKLSNETNSEFILLLIKITGISILAEFAVSICRDSGDSSIASKVDLGGKIIVISMSIPVISATLNGLLELLE